MSRGSVLFWRVQSQIAAYPKYDYSNTVRKDTDIRNTLQFVGLTIQI
jgi:hypothetical protein